MERLLRPLSVFGLAVALIVFPNIGQVTASSTASPVRDLEDLHKVLPDLDSRTAVIAPSASQLDAVSALGAHALWTKFGTPESLIKYGGFLATGLSGDPATAARAWVRANKALFQLSDLGVTNLELVNDSQLPESTAHVVLFRQRFGNLKAAQDGMITVG